MVFDTDAASKAEIMINATQLSFAELAGSLGLSEGTLDRRKRDGGFSRAERNKLVRIAHVLDRAQRVLGDKTRGLEWLKHPNRALYFRAPLALLGSKTGTQRVFAALARIEDGGFV